MIPLARPNILEEDIEKVNSVLRSGQLVQGKYVAELEDYFSSYIGCGNAIAVSNGTATLHLSLIALGIGPGDEVIVPAFSYIATANVVELVGATPVFVDISISTFNIDSNKIEEKINSKTRAIILVHEFGLPADLDEILNIAKANNILVIEDAACAFGATYKGKPVGSFGCFGSFSLHPRKAVTSGEGGVLIADSLSLANKVKTLRNHGISFEDPSVFSHAGFNYRMTDFQAALVLGQSKRINDILVSKQKIADVYLSEIKNDLITLPTLPTDRSHSWQTFHLLLDSSLNQKAIINYFKENEIGVNYGAQCIPHQLYYQKKYQLNCKTLFPNAMNAYISGLAIPCYETLTLTEIEKIIEITNKI